MSDTRIPGILIKDTREIKQNLSRLLEFDCKRFPGCQPISFDSTHLTKLLENHYFVSEKADGVRVLLYTTVCKNVENRMVGITYLIDRKNDYYQLNFALPHHKESRLIKDTLLDGELVYDKKKNANGEIVSVLYFLVFDCILYEGQPIFKKHYGKRIGYLREFILKPFLEYSKTNKQYESALPFQMRLKKLESSYNLGLVFEQIEKNYHKSDGIIFTKQFYPYEFGTCKEMIKWKPSEENTVDFLVKLNEKQEFIICLYYGQQGHQEISVFHLGTDSEKIPEGESIQNKIIECYYDSKWPHFWRFSRFRNDKETANHVSTYHKVMDSIRDNVTKQDVCFFFLNFIKKF